MEEWWLRILRNLISRLDGPLHFRFILQPLMAILFAIRDGIRDARNGNAPYLWAICMERDQRRRLLQKGWKSIGRVFLLALGLDVIYQITALPRVYPLEALLTAVLLAIVPYLLLCGPINRTISALLRRGTMRWWTLG
jgi:hypothetical protein